MTTFPKMNFKGKGDDNNEKNFKIAISLLSVFLIIFIIVSISTGLVISTKKKVTKSGYSGFGDTIVTSDGAVVGKNISNSKMNVSPTTAINTLNDKHYMTAPVSRLVPGMTELNLDKNAALISQIQNTLSNNNSGEDITKLTGKLSEGITAEYKGVMARMGGQKTKYEPLRTQGIGDQKNMMPRVNEVNTLQTGTAIIIPTYNVNPESMYVDVLDTGNAPSERSDKNINLFNSETLPPTQYLASKYTTKIEGYENIKQLDNQPVRLTPIVGVPQATKSIQNKIADNFQDYSYKKYK